MSTHLPGTFDLVKAVLVADASWIAACGGDPPADHIVTGMSGWPYEDTFLTDGGAKTLRLPLAQLAIGDGARWEVSGHRRWHRAGDVLIDVAMTAARTPAGYRAVVQLADDLMTALQAASDAGTFVAASITLDGPPMCYPPEAPALLRGAWSFRLRVGWSIGKPL